MTPPVYQFKIVLNGVKPPVWRRVLVAGESTISFFHEVVQVSMGWYNCHLTSS
jgi:formylmethanofuran:tetrahydromethanopterin formyltransferase